MNKKQDLPAMPFYFGDWRKAPEIRGLPLDVRMIWFEMLGFMWESTERGYLTVNGKPIFDITKLARMLGVSYEEMERALKILEDDAVFSRREDGAIYCRKMVKDAEISRIRAKAGKKGMSVRYNKNGEPVITKSQQNPEYENEDASEDVDINKERECEGEKEYPFSIDPKFKELWDAFVEMRKSCRAKPTKKAVELIMKKLHAQTLEDACAMLEQSIENNWKSVYPLKDGKDGKHNKTDNKRIATSFEGKNYNEGAF